MRSISNYCFKKKKWQRIKEKMMQRGQNDMENNQKDNNYTVSRYLILTKLKS